MRWLIVPAVFAALGMVVPLVISVGMLGIAWCIRQMGLAATLYLATFMFVGVIAS